MTVTSHPTPPVLAFQTGEERVSLHGSHKSNCAIVKLPACSGQRALWWEEKAFDGTVKTLGSIGIWTAGPSYVAISGAKSNYATTIDMK